MVKTIGNPLSWGVRRLGLAGHGIAESAAHMGSRDATPPQVRQIGTADLGAALRLGLDDFLALRSDALMVCLLYPVIGLALVWAALDARLLPLVFPLVSGFALLGPLAAVGLYEMSRRREAGQPAGWDAALSVLRAPALGAIVTLGIALLGLFLIWMLAAQYIYAATLGPEPPASLGAFLTETLTTGAGWAMIVIGTATGFVFAALVLSISVVSFPMLLDRDPGLPVAVVTSVRVARENPRTVAVWGLIVATSLVLGALPAFLGLAVVMPVLGHASWHLYRRAVARG
ncbi:DUF2189 domain-containing protein [Halovulum dunhuangense]|uniref:DUF2189 domain-containing protein n=1 Tax=Halovulum dunhuangense TaxID=1505036 RepID=A0A849L4F3_9RHOB|nr:DUF2189 domain-containing protein [Halovulum dunhuangense]NNU81308.1 DUF2189 domain-containing protein [Halovulum dunhuangense]